MKAAVVEKFGDVPHYMDFADPSNGQDEVLISVKAIPLENIDKAILNGTHYASNQFLKEFPAIAGFKGVGTLDDGTYVSFRQTIAPFGSMAEKTIVPKKGIEPIPDGLDPIKYSVISSAITALSLKTVGNLQNGEKVLIQGATGFAGKLAIQIAKLLGAESIIGTGRNAEELEKLSKLGVETIINTSKSDEDLRKEYTEVVQNGIDVVLDFLWGKPTEILIKSLEPKDFNFKAPTRLIQAGFLAGETISLASSSLRTSNLEIYGMGKGISQIKESFSTVIQWMKDDKLIFDIEKINLQDIEKVWNENTHGKRIIFIP